MITETTFLSFWRGLNAWRQRRGLPALYFGEARTRWLAMSPAWRR